ncbi:hypothetical protein CIK99_11640 [Prevotella sp. P5-92]|uniref:hypothetical protein n=1 Tax=Prevotella sp. P5-92 TaxID=2024222 RepID=UPI000BCB5427|nr:hypothetical protein [Prevotella sp. P5-92]OYP55113.1 hypothetical protein CIK99_11640 [Prevotella sp. P5-92]
METEVVKNTKENSKNNVVKNAVLAGGAAVAGAGSVLGAEAIIGHGVISDPEKEGKVAETDAAEQGATTQAESAVAQGSTPNANNDNHNTPDESQQAVSANNDPQPQDSSTNSNEGVTSNINADGGNGNGDSDGGNNNGGNVNGGGTSQGDGGSVIDNVNPNDVAQEIIEGDFIDPTDNDAPDLAITGVGTIQTLDGQVFTAAQIVGDNGDNLYMVDLNDDDMLDVVTTEEGYLVDTVDSPLTIDDAESIISQQDPNQGYLAAADETTATQGLDADIMDNITNLDA